MAPIRPAGTRGSPEGLGMRNVPISIWVFPKIWENPRSSILIGFSIINHPFWVVFPLFIGNTHFEDLWGDFFTNVSQQLRDFFRKICGTFFFETRFHNRVDLKTKLLNSVLFFFDMVVWWRYSEASMKTTKS